MAKVDLSKGCPNCGCIQFEPVGMFTFLTNIKNTILTICTLGFWMVWMVCKRVTWKGSPYRCVACKKYLPW